MDMFGSAEDHGTGYLSVGQLRRALKGKPATAFIYISVDGKTRCPVVSAKFEENEATEEGGSASSFFSLTVRRTSDVDQHNDIRDFEPPSLRHIIGHRHVVETLSVAVDAAFQDAKRLENCLLCGPPGLGKTTFAAVLARELCVPFMEILAQSITNLAELNALILAAPEKSILFIDEIHLLDKMAQH